MSIWYTNSEQPLRLEAYYCTNGLATMFGGLIGYAVGHITTGLPRWMYVFLIFGALSTAWGVVSFLVLPDTPATAKFLTDKERAIATGRVAQNRQGVKNHHFKWEQAVQCFTDPKTWILFVMATGAQVPNAAITSFTSLIVKSFGFDTLGTQYLQIPGGAVQFLALIIGGYVCTKWPNNSRCITMIVANLICILGAALLVGLPDSNKVSFDEQTKQSVNIADLSSSVGPSRGSLALLFPGPRLQHVSDHDIIQHCRVHEEAAHRGRPVHRLLRRQHHRTPDLYRFRSA